MDLHLLCTPHQFDVQTLEKFNDADWMGIDYGALMLIDAGITPIAAFGDFDSLSEEELSRLQSVIDVDILPSEKNETDLEVGVQYALSMDYDRVFIHGATGGRMDHFLGNLQILLNNEVLMSSTDFFIVDAANEIQMLPTGTHVITRNADMKYVSFIPVEAGVFLTIEDLKYTLPRTQLEMGTTRTISNEFVTGRAQITVENGMVYMIQSKDN
ncbi:thiamine diphosphokinase [Macrococcus hajekii]|uniref:Thiamine diphosphokinase n=1 Tax=Macrococcus hajekii TaxID=198482 RepID=A0A4R6BN05_9STAP|nr:thiamine diphosphokinase [Macrococcus hajekii]TDM03229.1 thiamine diphosphokinase [Macrococcus hajekii]GGA97122.1 thiamine pyrophosphokinase [Macrococcus hajekii]